MEFVVLVNENDQEIGIMEKQEAHIKGLLHRAFSVFAFNNKNELLIQQRAFSKYHSPGLWTNTCCSHPRQNEELIEAVKRRCIEEMGLIIDPKFQFSFIYKAVFENGLIEHEFDHVFFANVSSNPTINPTEVNSYKWISLNDLASDIAKNPKAYTEWFKICFEKVLTCFEKFSN